MKKILGKIVLLSSAILSVALIANAAIYPGTSVSGGGGGAATTTINGTQSASFTVISDGVTMTSTVTGSQTKFLINPSFAQASTSITDYFFGNAGNATLTGPDNTGVGFNSLNALTTGAYNSALGQYSLGAEQTGQANVAIGLSAEGASTAGFWNTAIGTNAGLTDQGNANIFIGYESGYSNITGSNNIDIGFNTNLPSSTTNNALDIGNLIYGSGLTNLASPTTTLSSGDITVGSSTDCGKLCIVTASNTVAFSVASTTNNQNRFQVLSATGTMPYLGVTSSGIPLMLGTSTLSLGGSSLALNACTSTVTTVPFVLSTSTEVVSTEAQTQPGAIGSLDYDSYISSVSNATSGITTQVCGLVAAGVTPTASKYNFFITRISGM